MAQQVEHYEFINQQTGNIISYVSLPSDMEKAERKLQLERKRTELAVANQLYIGLIYWQEHEHSIR